MTKEGSSKARLVLVATALFAKNGFHSTSLRAIAKEAGVSPALLVHHFGSREQLISTCISESLGEWMDIKKDMLAAPLSEAIGQLRVAMDDHGVQLDFFQKVLLAGGKNANTLFSRMVQEATQMLVSEIEAGNMRKLDNPSDVALVLTMHSVGALLIKEQVDQVLGADVTDPVNSLRLALVEMDIYTNGIYNNKTKRE
jgi:AcrR family transcriptional regulator